MKKLATLAILLCTLSAHALIVDWFTMSNYVAQALSGFSPGVGATTPAISTNGPVLYWTNNVASSFWITNANFNLAQVGLPSSNQYSSQFIISNSSSLSITSTLPFTAYSISMATNVVGAVVPPGTALALAFFDNPNGVIYVVDNGQNNPALLSLAAAVGSAGFGVLLSSGGTISSTTNLQLYSVAGQNAVYGSFFNNYPGQLAGIQMQSFDALGNVWMDLWNRAAVRGMAVSNATLDVSELVQYGSSGAQASDRFEHRSANLFFPANTGGERQFILNNQTNAVFGASASFISSPLYTPGTIASNLTSTAGFITNGNLVLCTTTNFPLATNLNYLALIGGGGLLYVSTNNAVTNVWVKR